MAGSTTPHSGAEHRRTLGYVASLDGARGLAVAGTIAFHLDAPWMRGGFLGVDLFFALSGFLITSLLIAEWRGARRVGLGAFWGRRARRLLPAAYVTLLAVAVLSRWTSLPWERPAVRGDGAASLLYVTNWRFVARHAGYFDLTAAPSPLRHMWSLAIEEQFYVLWPLVVLTLLWFGRGRLRHVALACGVLAAASAVAMAVVYRPGDTTRAYYGTDTRAQVILAGALLAVARAARLPGPRTTAALRFGGPLAGLGLLVMWVGVDGDHAFYYRGGALLHAVLASTAIAWAMTADPLRGRRWAAPLVWVGQRSYGLYLYHWPVIVWLTPRRVGIGGPALDALRVAVALVAATTSYRLFEQPIRERRWRSVLGHGHRWRPVLAGVTAGCCVATALASTAGAVRPSYLAGVRRPPLADAPPIAVPSPAPSTQPTAAPAPAASTQPARSPQGSVAAAPTSTPAETAIAAPPTTADEGVWHLGDPLFCGEPSAKELARATREAARSPARAPGPASILVLGDSTACSLYPGLLAVGARAGSTVTQAAVFGCGLASGEIASLRGEQITPDSQRCPAMVDEALRAAFRHVRPDVVVWMSIWEKSDLVVDGHILDATTTPGQDAMLDRMDAVLARIAATGARVVTVVPAPPAPNDALGDRNTSNPIDDASYARLAAIDARFAARHPGEVSVVDLAPPLCPAGPPCPAEVDGVRMRPDGRHFTPSAASTTAAWLWPQLAGTGG